MDLLIEEMKKLHEKNEFSKTITENYYEPGMMENQSEYDGYYDATNNEMTLIFDVKGTRYDNRSEILENIHLGDEITLRRDPGNQYNENNFEVFSSLGKIGEMPAHLCNVIAPEFDCGNLCFKSCKVNYIEPLSKRNRYATKAVVFIKLVLRYPLM